MKKATLFSTLCICSLLLITLGSCRKDKNIALVTASKFGISMKFINYNLSSNTSFDVYKGDPVDNIKIASLQTDGNGEIFIDKAVIADGKDRIFIINKTLGVSEVLHVSSYISIEQQERDNVFYDVHITVTHRGRTYIIDNHNSKQSIIVVK